MVVITDTHEPDQNPKYRKYISAISAYCKSGNFRATFIFALFTLQPGCAKLKAREYVHVVLRSMYIGKFKIANLKSSETIKNRQIAKITAREDYHFYSIQ